MWSPDLLALERAHVVHLALWGALSLALGGGLALALLARRAHAPLAASFGVQMAVVGSAELAYAAIRWRGMAERDYASALRLATHLRLAMVAEVWVIAAGAIVLWAGSIVLRRLALSGAGMAWMAHGAVLFLLDRAVLAHLTRGV